MILMQMNLKFQLCFNHQNIHIKFLFIVSLTRLPTNSTQSWFYLSLKNYGPCFQSLEVNPGSDEPCGLGFSVRV